MTAYPIWQMKYCTKSVLVDTCKVNPGKCYIYFVADRNYKDLYSFDGDRVKKECGLIYNGKIYCFDIPISWLNNEGPLTPELEKHRENEYERFKKFVAKNKKVEK